jgi:hypothetical protein
MGPGLEQATVLGEIGVAETAESLDQLVHAILPNDAGRLI